MWLLGFFVLPMVLVASVEFKIDNYVVKIEAAILKSVQANEKSLIELNLSGYSLREIDQYAFNDPINIKILNISNNHLVGLPESVFSKLTNLQHLSLANNEIKYFVNKPFVGLDNLKSLDISNNPLGFLASDGLFGLRSSVNIFTSGTPIHKISTSAFGKNTESARELKVTTRNKRQPRAVRKTIPIKVCIDGGELTLVDYLKENEKLTRDCIKTIYEFDTVVSLDNLNITSFKRGWYRVAEESIEGISLRNNAIAEVTSELLNDLPKNIEHIDLDGNAIERVKREIIENFHMDGLSLNNNLIREIDSGAFERTNIRYLFVDENLLSDIKFTGSLPNSIEAITVRSNQLTEIPDGCFSSLGELRHLHLDGNYITEIRKNSLLGLSRILNLGLTNNQIKRIETDTFRELKYLYNLFLRNNSLHKLENGTFRGIETINHIDLSINKFTDAKQIRDSLPQNLQTLSLEQNEIGNLESDSFVNTPKRELFLRGNMIRKIAKGSFRLPNLFSLDLGNNSLSHIDRDAFENSRSIQILSLNENSITEIEKGFAKHMNSISELDISNNPIKKLMNGALFGMTKDADRFILTSQTPIELIQGGLFDNI